MSFMPEANVRCLLTLNEGSDVAQPAQLIETKKNLSKRTIEQLGVVQDIQSLVVLSGTSAQQMS